MTAEELAADHKDQVELRVPPDSPLEIVDLHVLSMRIVLLPDMYRSGCETRLPSRSMATHSGLATQERQIH